MEKQHKRKHPVSISIKGIYHPDGDDEPTEAELITDGYKYRLGKHWYVTYVETETTGYEGCITTLKVAVDDSDEAGNVVTLTRKGDASSHLIMQRGVRTLGSYNVFGNTMELGV